MFVKVDASVGAAILIAAAFVVWAILDPSGLEAAFEAFRSGTAKTLESFAEAVA